MKCFFVFLSCLIALHTLAAQDMIYKKDNSTVKAKVLEVNATDIIYKLFDYPDSPFITLSKDDISVIIYQNGKHEVFNRPSETPDSTQKGPARTRNIKNLVFVELGGNGGIYSLNYEHRFRLPANFSVTARIGYSGIPANAISISKYRDCQTIPLALSLLYGKVNIFELGIGYTPLIITEKNLLYDFRNYVAPSFGYRYQSNHFVFRTGLVVGIEVDRYPINHYIPAPYVGCGYAF